MHVSWKGQRPRDSGNTVWRSGDNSDGIDFGVFRIWIAERKSVG